MRVKIAQPGWDSYNGPLYGVEFENGVSTDHIRRDQALQLGALLAGVVEIDEDGNELGPVSPAHDLVMSAKVTAEVVEPMKNDAERAADTPVEAEGEGAEPASGPQRYAEAELIEIADTKGINGLREIATPLGVKSTAIRVLIRDILAAQNSV